MLQEKRLEQESTALTYIHFCFFSTRQKITRKYLLHYKVIIYKNWGKDSKTRQSRQLTADAGSFALIPPPLRVLRVIAETGESVEFPAKIRNSNDEKKRKKNDKEEISGNGRFAWKKLVCLRVPRIAQYRFLPKKEEKSKNNSQLKCVVFSS